MMKLTRRQMLLAGLGLMATGCAQQTGLMSDRPRTDWPSDFARPRPSVQGKVYAATPPAQQPVTPQKPLTITGIASTPVAAALHARPRASWATKPPIMARINPMNGIHRITCHHEGWKPVWFNDVTSTKDRLETIRVSHINRLRAADIGYHFIIDRAGRLWEGRSLVYQGAHVKDHNEHNLGIMTLGNFDRQSPTTAQLLTLEHMLAFLRHQYRVPVAKVYTHQELNPTRCPGLHLQPRIVAMRQQALLG